MTEDDAKKKWCPMSRYGDFNLGGALNRGLDEAGTLNCVGSSCMMWRWEMTPSAAARTKENNDVITSEPSGFCGLSGRFGHV